MRPGQLLAGKVVGIGVVALLQAVSLVAFALVLAEVVGSNLVHGAAPLVVAATLVWLVLGYAFYSWVYAAAGSLAERQDQVQSLALPLSAPLIFGYIVSLIGVSSGSASLARQGAGLPATDRTLRHADVGGVRRGHLVAVFAVGGRERRVHRMGGAGGGPRLPHGHAPNRETRATARADPDSDQVTVRLIRRSSPYPSRPAPRSADRHYRRVGQSWHRL